MGGEAPAWADLVAERIDFLTRLAADPARKPALERELDCSRSTVDRAIRRLESAGLVERTGEGYTATAFGRVAAERYRRYLANQRIVGAAQSLLETMPADASPPPELLAGGEVELAKTGSGGAFDRIARQLREATRYRGVLPAVGDSRHLRLLHARVIEDDLRAEVVVAPALAERLRTEFPRLTADLLAAESCTLGRADTPPYGVLHAASEAGTTALLAFPEDGSLAGVVENGDERACARAAELIDEHVGDHGVLPEPATDSRGKATPVAAPEQETRRRLAAAGLTRVDRSYFAERTPGDPRTAWRIGFGLPEVYYGYAVEREAAATDGEGAPAGQASAPGSPALEKAGDVGPNEGIATQGEATGEPAEPGDRAALAGRLVDRLVDGDDGVVLGPAGAGKSTVCKQVACRWIEAGHGPVYYREGTATGEELPAAGEVVSPAEGHALVIIENVSEPVAEPVLSLLRIIRDDPSVTLLLEAREGSWSGVIDSVSDPGLRELARTLLSTYRMPRVDERTCQRAIDAFEAATDRSVPLSAAELHDLVSTEGGLGEMQVLSYQIVGHATPLKDGSDDRSGLASDIRTTYEALMAEDTEDELPMTVGILAAALTAADQRVTPGLLHAVAADREDRVPAHRGVESAIDALDGRMFVRRDDGPGYRTQHPRWAVRFLEHTLDRAQRETVALFERGVNAILALADDRHRRARIEEWLGRDAPGVERFADPEQVDAFVETLFGLGVEQPTLAELFGTTDHSGLVLPDACSVATALEAQSCRGFMWYDRGEPERAAAEFEALREAAAAAEGDPRARTNYQAEAARGLAAARSITGETETAREHLQQGLEAAREGKHRRQEIGLLNSVARVAINHDDYDRAAEHLERALEIAEDHDLDDSGAHATTCYYTAKLHLLRGDLPAAETWADDTVALDRQLGNRGSVSSSLKLQGDIAKDRGDLDHAVDRYRRSLELNRQLGDQPGVSQTLFDLGDAYLLQDEYDQAAAAFERSLAIARENDMERHVGRVHAGLGRLALARDRPDRASDHFETLREMHEELGHERGVARAAVGLGDVATHEDDLEQARERYREGFERFRAIDARLEALDALEKLVDACLLADDEAAARRWCETGVDYAGDDEDRAEKFADQLVELGEEVGSD